MVEQADPIPAEPVLTAAPGPYSRVLPSVQMTVPKLVPKYCHHRRCDPVVTVLVDPTTGLGPHSHHRQCDPVVTVLIDPMARDSAA